MAQQPDKSRQQIIQNLHEEPCGVEACVVPAAQPSATQQRLRIHIPDPRTTLLLGQRILGGNPFGYPGVSLQTVENLFADIKKSTVLQSHGSLLLQTGAQWQQFAEELMDLSSRGAVRVTSGRVWIGAIDKPRGFDLKQNHGESLQFGADMDLQSYGACIQAMKSDWEKIATALNIIYSMGSSTLFGKLGDWIQTVWTKLTSIVAVMNTWTNSPKNPMDVNIYGQEGVNITSPSPINLATSNSANIFATNGVTMTSALPSIMQSASEVRCLGGMSASLEAVGYSDVKAVYRVGISSLWGAVSVQGSKIEIGSKFSMTQPLAGALLGAGMMAGSMKATSSLGSVDNQQDSGEQQCSNSAPGATAVKASKPVAINAMPLSLQAPTKDINIKATERIVVDSGEQIYIKSSVPRRSRLVKGVVNQVVSIQVGSYTVEVKPGGIKIGKGSDRDPSNSLVLINNNRIEIKRGDMVVEVKPNRVRLGLVSNNSHFSIDRQGHATVKGRCVKLG